MFDIMIQQLFIFFTYIQVIATNDYHPGSEIAANEHLFAYKSHAEAIRYQCSSNREKVSEKTFRREINTVGIGKAQNRSQLYFVVAGDDRLIPCMSKISINCNNDSELKEETVCFNETRVRFSGSDLIIVIDPHGRYAIDIGEINEIRFLDLLNLKHSIINITWPNCTRKFTPYAADISTQFIYVIGYCIETRNVSQGGSKEYFKLILYLLSIAFDNNQYKISIHDLWLYETLHTNSNLEHSSISVNDGVEEKILVGFPANNTVHLLLVDKSMKPYRLQHISSKQVRNTSDFLYGTNVAWLNQGQKAVVSYSTYCGRLECSGLFLYDMENNSQFTEEIIALSTFPNIEQQYPYAYNTIATLLFLVATSNNPSSLYIYNSVRHVLVLLPSRKGYHSTGFGLNTKFSEEYSLFFLFPNTIPCPFGTYKNDVGIWPCSLCNGTVTNSSQLQAFNEESISLTCPQCSDKESCPLQFAYEVNDFPDIEQNGGYPEASEIDVFDDILLYQMFRTDCHWNSPFYLLLICLFVILFFSILISLLKLNKQFTRHYRHLTKTVRHLDLIEQGQSWFGGMLTAVVIILLGFAVRFSHVYHYQYPLEKQQNTDNNTCHPSSQLNAKFDTTLQFVGSSSGQYQEVFNLLDSQQFTLNIELINTILHSGQLTLHYADSMDSLPFSYYTIGRVLFISTNLSAHNLNLRLTFKGNETIDAIRIGVTGSDAYTANNYLQKLNFSKIFRQANHIFKKNPAFNLQLTKVINVTESLNINGETTYSCVWFPTFTFDFNQLFEYKNLSTIRNQTIISISISETPFFIRNKQEAIAKRSEIIFKTIIFAMICLDFTCMILLLSKLWLLPLLKIFIDKLFAPTSCLRRFIVDDKGSLDKEIIALKNKLNSIEIEMKKIRQFSKISESHA